MQKNKGSALLTTLLVMSFAAVTMMALVNIQQILTYRTEQTIRSQENFQYVMGVEDWAVGQLYHYVSLDDQKRSEMPFPIRLANTPLPYGAIEGVIVDAEGGFNINSLGFKPDIEGLTKGILAIYPAMKPEQASVLIESLISHNAPENATPTSHFFTPTELRASNVVTPQEFERMNQWMVALPEKTPLSVNTASSEALIIASAGNIDRASADAFIAARDKFGWISDLTALTNMPEYKAIETSNLELGLTPRYFWILTTIKGEDLHDNFYTLLKVEATNGKMDVKILWRSYGTW